MNCGGREKKHLNQLILAIPHPNFRGRVLSQVLSEFNKVDTESKVINKYSLRTCVTSKLNKARTVGDKRKFPLGEFIIRPVEPRETLCSTLSFKFF